MQLPQAFAAERAQKNGPLRGPFLHSFRFFAAFWPQKFPYSITRTKTVEPLAKRVRTRYTPAGYGTVPKRTPKFTYILDFKLYTYNFKQTQRPEHLDHNTDPLPFPTTPSYKICRGAALSKHAIKHPARLPSPRTWSKYEPLCLTNEPMCVLCGPLCLLFPTISPSIGRLIDHPQAPFP